MPTGRGIIEVGSDFTAGHGTAAAIDATGIQVYGVGTEVYGIGTTPNGVLAMATGGSDDDNVVLRSGQFRPIDGMMKVSARFNYSNVDCAIFIGFSKTLDTTTPVMPAEFATATMTYNGTAGLVGLQYDVDGTTDDFRAVMGDGGAAKSDSSNGIRANATVTAALWFEAEVIVFPDGSAECWLGDSGHANKSKETQLRLIKKFTSGTLLTPTDQFFSVLMIENRSGNTRTLNVDYFYTRAGRSWAYDV